MLEHNRVIFCEVSRDQLVCDYYLLVLYMSVACSNMSSVGSWTRAHANRGHRARSSIPRVFKMSYLSMRKRLGGRSTLEQGSMWILGHLGNDCARAERAWLCLCSSRASTVVPLLEHAEHKSILCSSMLVHNTKRSKSCKLQTLKLLRLLYQCVLRTLCLPVKGIDILPTFVPCLAAAQLHLLCSWLSALL